MDRNRQSGSFRVPKPRSTRRTRSKWIRYMKSCLYRRMKESSCFQSLRVIRGPKTGMHAVRQIEIQPKGGWIVISQMTAGELPEPDGTYIGVYSINDSGNMPPRWKIDGKPSTGMKKPHGIALDPNHKEVIVADMRLNAILTFYFPEIF